MDRLTQSDLDFLEQFERCKLDKSAWTHAAHLRMAWIQLCRAPFSLAQDRVREGIQRLNAALKGVGYHETVTIAFTRLIQARMQTLPQDHLWSDFLKENEDLLRPILKEYYTDERMGNEESKSRFLAPDKRPLPALGTIRFVREDDAGPMLSLYSRYIENSPVSFELKTPSEAEFLKRVRAYSSYAPWLVFESEGRVQGYAYASKHREREAYQWTVETSVYVSSRFHRQEIARMLYTRLFHELRRRGFYLALAGITLPNESSVRFHESMGFQPIGVYRNIGFKLGRWHDVGWWQREIQPPAKTPTPIH